MVNRCIVPECFSYGNRGYFSFPKNEERRKLWFEILGLWKSLQLRPGQCVCYRHFDEKDITMKKNGNTLSKSKNCK
jgi:hypothetical protein